MTYHTLSAEGFDIIKRFEGFRPTAYKDAAGIPTIGYGFTQGVGMGDTMTRAQADARLLDEVTQYVRGVLAVCSVPPTQHQLDAMTSLAYNIGVAGFQRSTVCRAHNAKDWQAASRAFGLWNRAGGKVYAGLTRRRAAEAALYLKPDPVSVPMHEHVEDDLVTPRLEVETERPLHASEIVRAGVTAGGTAAVATVAETTRVMSDVKQSADSLGTWLVPILLCAVVGLCAYVVWVRFKQRKDGWA